SNVVPPLIEALSTLKGIACAGAGNGFGLPITVCGGISGREKNCADAGNGFRLPITVSGGISGREKDCADAWHARMKSATNVKARRLMSGSDLLRIPNFLISRSTSAESPKFDELRLSSHISVSCRCRLQPYRGLRIARCKATGSGVTSPIIKARM